MQLENRSLELVAAALSEEYGISVVCSGLRAGIRRNEKGRAVITIPAIPAQDENYRSLVRGYIDHEAGHLRFSDSAALERGILSRKEMAGALKAVASIYEDIFVDRLMGECFTGCRRNLRRLALLVYGAKPLPDIGETGRLAQKMADGIVPPAQMPWHIWNTVLQYIIYTARANELPRLADHSHAWRNRLDILAPGLAPQIVTILERLSTDGNSSSANIALAIETVELIRSYLEKHFGNSEAPWAEKASAELPWLLRNGGAWREQADMGNAAAGMMDEMLADMGEELANKIVCIRHKAGSEMWQARLLPLSDEERLQSLQAAAKMAAQMHSLLQSHMLNREGPFKQGKLDTRNLHKLFIGRDDIFCRNIERKGINTEIIICIDMSGSMRFEGKAAMASMALYAVAESLARIIGLKLHILGFFDNNLIELHKPGQTLNPRMQIVPDGGTLCAPVLRESAQYFSPNPKMRKIILMLTDGDANDPENFLEAIADMREAGIELLGIGIQDEHIMEYMAAEDCRVIRDLHELAGCILALLRHKMDVRG